MFPSKVLLTLVFITLSVVDASPLSRRNGKANLNFVTTINGGGSLNLAQKDQARAQVMKQRPSKFGRRTASIDVANNGVTYTAQVGVGNPATTYTLLIDTGSANTFVGAGSIKYAPTSTSLDTGNTASVSYGSGSWSGEEWTDMVTLSPELVIEQQSIGVASTATGLDNVDGILGVGPTGLTTGTVSNTNTVPTVMDNLYSQGTIDAEVLGVYYVPASESSSTGTLTFGGFDGSVITSEVVCIPITTTSPASTFWGIDGSITYGGTTILSSTAGIVDTGTTLILMATDAFQQYQSVTGGTLDSATGLLKITSEQYDALQPLSFMAGGVTYTLPPNGQIWPRSLNTDIGGDANSIYLVAGDTGSASGSGLDFMLGYTFLERFYSIYDTTNQCVGLATTDYTDSTSN